MILYCIAVDGKLGDIAFMDKEACEKQVQRFRKIYPNIEVTLVEMGEAEYEKRMRHAED